jgi:hypothetical protein
MYASELNPIPCGYALANAHKNFSADQLIVFAADVDSFFTVRLTIHFRYNLSILETIVAREASYFHYVQPAFFRHRRT